MPFPPFPCAHFSGLEYLPIMQPSPPSPAGLFLHPKEKLHEPPSPMLLLRPFYGFDSSRNLLSRSICSLFSCDQLSSLSAAVQHVTERPSFSRPDNIPCITFCLCNHQSSISGHWGRFHLLATVNNTTVIMGVHISSRSCCQFFCVKYPEAELWDHNF